MIRTIAVFGYRSIRDVVVALEPLTLITGGNGSGKSSLYRSLRLLADVARGNVVRALALEGGFDSVLWAGRASADHVSLKLGFAYDDYGYAIDLGLPIPNEESHFNRDPYIKLESLWVGQVLRPNSEIARRHGLSVRIRDERHVWTDVPVSLSPYDSMMTHAADPRHASELLLMRESMRNWRFYDQFRTDRDAPARHAQIGTYTLYWLQTAGIYPRP